ncbi:AAA family ATPase [Prescottella agglutinans]|uniref:AAA family ATPase n=1 Tax=Prescottella agglutinans TaxID=1644129 RepID=UPI003D96D01E
MNRDSTSPILPAWPAFVRPTLAVLSDGETWRTADLRDAVADAMQLTDSQRAEQLDSGQSRAANRVGWALSMLKRAGAASQVRNGYSVITDFGHQLLASQPGEITEADLAAIPAFQEYVPKKRKHSAKTVDEDGPSYWFVGAYYSDFDPQDQTGRFIADGIWENGYDDKYLDDVKSMQPGERIAIKAAFRRGRDIPFDTNGHSVSVMAIKATGTITANRGDGRTVEVDWDPQEDVREWFLYTNRLTVWRVRPGDWRTDGLIDFTFDGEEQDLDRFRNSTFWVDRFGDDAGLADEPDIEDEIGADEEELQGAAQGYALTDIVADGCFVPASVLGDYLNALRTKKNLILQGPPGTGKTWLAKRLGYALIGGKDRNLLRAIQFHPTLAYEDFVRGWRPSGDGRLQLEDGIFLDIVNAAQADPGHNHVVVIEEINRGNLAQIFGELLTLLENSKRTPDEALELSYRRPGEPPTYLPENLYIIGTMNLADRSLAIVDFALRRRFAFRNLEPTLNEAWRRWVSEHNGLPDAFLTALAQRVGALNDAIAGDRSLGEQYRIGHSFFTPHGKTRIDDPDAWLRQVVDSEIRPLLDEYWFDDPERVEKETEALLGSPL